MHIGLSANPSRWKFLLRVLCPVSVSVTTLAWASPPLLILVKLIWGDPDVDGRMLEWNFKKWDVGVRTGLGWLRKGTGGGSL
jgi:hypothetical protein